MTFALLFNFGKVERKKGKIASGEVALKAIDSYFTSILVTFGSKKE